MRWPALIFFLLASGVLVASGCSSQDRPAETFRTTTTPPAPPGPNAFLPCPDLTDFALIPEADQTAYLTTGVPCDRPDLWKAMGNQLLRQAENPICAYGWDPPMVAVRDEAAAEILRNQLPENIRDDMEIEIGCGSFLSPDVSGPVSNEPDLGDEDANTIAREMLAIGADLGVGCPCGVAVNPDGSIVATSGDQALADAIEVRAKELGIEVTVLGPGEFTPPQRYGL